MKVNPPGPDRHTSSPQPSAPLGICSLGSNFIATDHLPDSGLLTLSTS